MREEVLHYLWKFRKLKRQEFKSIDGQEIRIIHPGMHNQESGPDFLNARISINGIEWNGHVEIHVNSSDWIKHRHQHDPAYGNVILHVVYHCDKPVFTYSGVELIQVEIKNLVVEDDLENAAAFIRSKRELPCAVYLPAMEEVITRQQKENALFQRLENRFDYIRQELEKSNYHWEQVTYKLIAKAFGTRINKFPFERLAEVAPVNLLNRESFSPVRAEAILFHFSGLLQNETSEYAKELIQASSQAGLKYPGMCMNKSEWKFSARPHNFPTIRLAQFSDLVYRQKQLFSPIIETRSLDELLSFFSCKASEFWDNHFTFEQASPKISIKKPGDDFTRSLVINAAIPVYFAYGKLTNRQDMVEQCLQWLEELPPEKNSVTEVYTQAGIKNQSAFDTQALVELKNSFCTPKKCLTCSIGINIISRKKNTVPLVQT